MATPIERQLKLSYLKTLNIELQDDLRAFTPYQTMNLRLEKDLRVVKPQTSNDPTELPSPKRPIDAQIGRRQAVRLLHRNACLELYGADGVYVGSGEHDARGNLWHAMSFFEGELVHVERANAMIRHVLPSIDGHFFNSAITSILSRYGAWLDADLREACLLKLSQNLEADAGQRFRGYNDNYPAMAALSVLVGGPLCGETRFHSEGLENLRSLQRLFGRRGLLSEHNSPTYTPITLTCLAEIVELAPDEEARELARMLEQRIWLDLTAHFHAATSFIAGPYSRAYTGDLCAHIHNAHAVLFQAFGNAVFVNPLTGAFPPMQGQALHGHGAAFMQAHVAWHTTAIYHPDAKAGSLMAQEGPREIYASAEQAPFPRGFWKSPRLPHKPLDEFPAGVLNTYTFIDPVFAYGISDRPFLDGAQHAGFHALYTRQEGSTDLKDVGTLFSRFTIGSKPLLHHKLIPEEGRVLALAKGDTAMVLYRGRPQWGDPPAGLDHNSEPVDCLRVSLLGNHFWSKPQAIWLGDSPCIPWKGKSLESVSIFIHDGPMYFAIHPLVLTNFGRSAAIRLDQENGFGLIHLINYEGEGRTFSDLEIAECLNGFVIVFGRADVDGDFHTFRKVHSKPQISDTYLPSDGMRLVTYQQGGLQLAMEVSPLSDGIKSRTINGRAAPEPYFAINQELIPPLHPL